MIRKATENDYEGIWEIFKSVIKTEDTYVFYSDTPKKDLNEFWLAQYMQTYVFEENDKILGSYILKPNQLGLGQHIANASYMVHPQAIGKSIGRRLGEHSLKTAKEQKYIGMQFNIVVSTNIAAINLWKKLGFDIVGTTPNGFKHKDKGFVDTFIMYKSLI